MSSNFGSLFAIKEVTPIEPRHLPSRENELKIKFALQYDPCKTHRLCVMADFSQILSKIFRFFETFFSIFFICLGKVGNTAGSPGGPAAPCNFFSKSNCKRARFETLKKVRVKVAFQSNVPLPRPQMTPHEKKFFLTSVCMIISSFQSIFLAIVMSEMCNQKNGIFAPP